MRLFGVYNTNSVNINTLYRSVFSCARTMYLRYFLNENGDRQYTLATIDPSGKPTLSAHPARFSPEDKYSRQRITIKKRFGLLITQQPEPIH